MKYRICKTGFTLIEMLVAMAIVVSIVSMVYGSYFATARSAEIYKSRMTVSEEVRSVLQRMSGQIRCAYARLADGTSSEPKALPVNTEKVIDESINCFKAGVDLPDGQILNLVTTDQSSLAEGRPDGLHDVAYRFDRNEGILFMSSSRAVHGKTPPGRKRDWSPLIEKVRHIRLAFFDGKQWWSEWDFEKNNNLPAAVSITVACEDENSRQCVFSTVAYVAVHREQTSRDISKR
ncbi:MAG: prepilin-type N-terminal cleavage/methylation domain-containing protein [Sedimentisphaerales bacterium]|nr:prepilin-type N-terminal cleavage/methylation domain-containing protein [Sedimentisphaerales bacterium]